MSAKQIFKTEENQNNTYSSCCGEIDDMFLEKTNFNRKMKDIHKSNYFNLYLACPSLAREDVPGGEEIEWHLQRTIDEATIGGKASRGAVSRDAGFIRGLAMKRAANAVDMMRLLPQLCDPQSELLLLRSCMGIAKLFFGLRTCQPEHMEEAASFFDQGLREGGGGGD
ncbi:hypothetical protein LXL04_012208 [Taraxacum kok-saghyz]